MNVREIQVQAVPVCFELLSTSILCTQNRGESAKITIKVYFENDEREPTEIN